MGRNILIIAYKFNDIYYAINTIEFRASNKRNLIIFTSGDLAKENFPFLHLFDSVRIISFRHSIYFLPITISRLSRIINLFNKDEPIIFLSNIEIIINQYLVSRFPKSPVILVEDGVMNYYYDKIKEHKDSFLKKTVLLMLNVKKNIAPKRIQFTYLHLPVEAIYYYGEKRQLKLHHDIKINDSLIDKLEGKNILVGGGYLETIGEEERVHYVQRTIEKFNIDFFIPHHFSPPGLYDLSVIFDMQIYNATFEMIFPFLKKLKIYSFGSSVLLSASVINKEIETNFIDVEHSAYSSTKAMKFLKGKSTHIVNL